MTLSPGTMQEILESAQDGSIDTAEVGNVMSGVFDALITGMVVLGMMNVFIKVTNPPKQEAKELRDIAKML